MKKVFYFLLFTLILVTCKNEEHFDFPIVQTGEIAEIYNTGVTFYGKLISEGSSSINNYGFVWDTKENPEIETSYSVSLGKNPGTIFSYNVTSALVVGVKYYVRAYVSDLSHIVYGKTVSFVSLGSKLPQIRYFSPKMATWGDTLTIIGENFSLKRGENKVKIGTFESETIDEADSIIRVIVPYTIDTTNIPVSAGYLNYKAVSSELFNLLPPVITDFNPKLGTYKTIVSISGNHFHDRFSKVFFNDIEAQIKEISESTIVVEVPKGISEGNIKISVEVASQKTEATNTFYNQAPRIIEVSPMQASWDDIITINGIYFTSNINDIQVKFNDINASVVEATPNQISVKVPSDLLSEKSNISVTINEQTSLFGDEFTLFQPEISSFTPTQATFEDIISIEGNYFNPNIIHDNVYFGDTVATVIESSSTRIKVKVPNNYYSTDGKNKIGIKIGDLTTSTTTDFELAMHSITNFLPADADRSDIITITGDNFNPTSQFNKVYIGDTLVNVINSTKNTLSITLPERVLNGDQFIRINVAGREVSSSGTIMIHEPWKRLKDFSGGPRIEAISFTINNKAYIGGGFESSSRKELNDFWEYDAPSDTWTKKANMPLQGIGIVSFSTNNYGYILKENKLWQYSPDIDKWTEKSDFPGLALSGQAGFAIENTGYVGTGIYTSGLASTDEFYKYDESTDSWVRLEDFIGGDVYWGTGFSIGNKGYIFNGWSKKLYEYDPFLNTWSLKMDLTNILYQKSYYRERLWTSTFTLNGKGYILAGFDDYTISTNTYKDIYEYDPIDNSIRRYVDLPADSRGKAVGFSLNNLGYFGTGTHNLTNEDKNDFWEFNPANAK